MFLKKNFGDDAIPKGTWQASSFGPTLARGGVVFGSLARPPVRAWET